MTNNDDLALKAEQCANILENIAGFESDDIDGDDIDLRFDLDGLDTGCTVSIVGQCQGAADALRALLAERDADKKRIAEQRQYYEGVIADGSKRIAKLEAQTASIKFPKEDIRDASDFSWTAEVVPLDVVKEACAAAGIKLEVEE